MAKKKTNKNWLYFAVSIAVIVLFVLFIFQFANSSLGGDICKRDLECFLVNCKSTPYVVDCINSTHQEIYYKQCKDYTDVNIVTPQDFTKCGCVQGICKVK